MNKDVLQKCVLFQDLNEQELAYALEFFHAQERTFRRNEYVHQSGSRMSQFGLVLSGHIQVFMDDFDGNRMIMANVTPGNTFGESLCYLNSDTQVYIESVSVTDVLCMDTESLIHPAKVPTLMDLELTNRFTKMLAQRTLHLNDRIQILSKLTIREKVITLLSQYISQTGSSLVRLPFSRENMATYLGVNQSALSRVLSQMEKEGVFRFKGNTFDVITLHMQ